MSDKKPDIYQIACRDSDYFGTVLRNGCLKNISRYTVNNTFLDLCSSQGHGDSHMLKVSQLCVLFLLNTYVKSSVVVVSDCDLKPVSI